MGAPRKVTTLSFGKGIVLLVILAVALVLNLWNNGFPLGYHFDEPLKVQFIQEHTQNFFHPILMLLVSRFAAALTGTSDAQALVELGRTITALFAVFNVYACVLLFRKVGGDRDALWTAAAVAIMPILVVHAHYLKEDLYVTPFLLLSLHSFLLHRERGRRSTLLWWGVTTGLALSSKYTALLLFALYWFAPRLLHLPGPKEYRRELARMSVVALAVFLAVDYPIFEQVKAFFQGFEHELSHAFEGHKIRVWPWEHLFTFHLRYSLAPGMTWLWVILAGMGLVQTLRRPDSITPADRLLIAFLALWIGVSEFSPTKPFPDFMRYMIPVVPVLVFYAVRAVTEMARRLPGRERWTIPALLLLVLIWPAYESVRLVLQLEEDSRDLVAQILADRHAKVVFERYSAPKEDIRLVTKIPAEEIVAKGIEFLVTSSFSYDRYALGGSMMLQKTEVYRHARRYEALFAACPFETVPATYKPYAFSNPNLRIVDVRECMRGFSYAD
jgi:4-amino-4-deoxy-L-arabinose transferase-like glycosyltransferase